MSKLVISCGLSAVGKSSFFEKALKKRHNAVYLVKDSVNDGFILDDDGFLSNEKKPDGDFYLRNIRLQSYKALFNLARDNLKIGKDVIIDGYFIYKIGTPEFDKLLKIVSDVEHDLKFIYFHCSKKELKRRTEKRERGDSWEDVKKRHLGQFEERYKKAMKISEEFPFHLKLNMEEDYEKLFNEFEKMMES